MDRIFVRLLPAIVLCAVLFSFQVVCAEDNGETIQSVVGVDTLPHVVWSFPSLLNAHGTDEIDYDMDATQFTSYEANVRFNRFHTALGLSAVVDDNVVGEVDRYAGYIAVKNIFIRYSQGKIKGTADWNGSLATGMAPAIAYDHDVRSYEINYMFNDNGPDKAGMTAGWYVGMGYTTMTVPIEIHTMTTTGGKENQIYGVPVYDDAFEVTAYCAQFGFDTMLGDMAKGRVKPGDIKFFAHAQDTLGFGQGTVSPESAAWAEELNPGRTFMNKDSFIVYLQNDSTLGFFWAPSLLRGHAVLALGYNLNFSVIMSFSGGASDATELGYDASFGLLRHGPQFRAYATW
ncbi:MAG: hypothetical protein KKD44_08105 [Proteobacteria bacterium]|nr:hypothetical protein [Pseudomonadota bacterium]